MYVDVSILIALSALLLMVVYLFKRLDRLSDQVAEMKRGLERRIEEPRPEPFGQMEALIYVRDRLDLKKGIPYTKDWSASPDFLKLITEYCLEAKPQLILECSSGATSLVLARCCELNGSGHLCSLEDGEQYAVRSRGHIERYGLGARADTVHAPLEPVALGAEEYLWYATEKIPEGPVDMLVIDGPSGFIQKNSRYPALPILFGRLADGCAVFLDDAARVDEKGIVARWLKEFPGTEHEYIKTERGCARLTIRR